MFFNIIKDIIVLFFKVETIFYYYNNNLFDTIFTLILFQGGKALLLKIRWQTVFLICILFIMSACSSYKTPIKIGINDWPPCELWYIAEEIGCFVDVPVEIHKFSTWSDSMKSLYLGKVDITHSTYFNTVLYDGKGEAAKIILVTETINGADGLVVKRSIKNMQNLAGKVIAVETETDEHFLLNKVLKSAGLTGHDVNIISTDSSEAGELFIKGEVDACFTYEPFLSRAAQGGNGEIVFKTSDELNYLDTLLARDRVLQERKEDYAKIVRAWYKAQEFVVENPDEAYEIMSAKAGMNYDEFKNFYEGLNFLAWMRTKRYFLPGK